MQANSRYLWQNGQSALAPVGVNLCVVAPFKREEITMSSQDGDALGEVLVVRSSPGNLSALFPSGVSQT
jgi:hypothetical protein